MNQNYVLSSRLTDNHYLVRPRSLETHKRFSKTDACGKLLDIGCGQKPMEAFRVLKPGGYAIYSVPLFWHLHEEPRDFYRYIKYGLRYLFEKVGFEVVVLHPCGGFWVTVGSMFNYYLSSFARGPLRYVVNAIKVVNNMICLKLDRWHKVEKFTWMYLVIAQKPAGVLK